MFPLVRRRPLRVPTHTDKTDYATKPYSYVFLCVLRVLSGDIRALETIYRQGRESAQKHNLAPLCVAGGDIRTLRRRSTTTDTTDSKARARRTILFVLLGAVSGEGNFASS
jgi:hypothetical protein